MQTVLNSQSGALPDRHSIYFVLRRKVLGHVSRVRRMKRSGLWYLYYQK
jgi:hypothetical protein